MKAVAYENMACRKFENSKNIEKPDSIYTEKFLLKIIFKKVIKPLQLNKMKPSLP